MSSSVQANIFILSTSVQKMTYYYSHFKDYRSFCCEWISELFLLSPGSVWFLWSLVVLLHLKEKNKTKKQKKTIY